MIEQQDEVRTVSLTEIWRSFGGKKTTAPAQWRYAQGRRYLEQIAKHQSTTPKDLFRTRCYSNGGETLSTEEIASEYRRFLERISRTRRGDGHLYFIQCQATQLIKIGVSKNPQQRFRALCCQASTPLSLLGIFRGGTREEEELHSQFAPLRHHGEWFEPGTELIEFIETSKRNQRIQTTPGRDTPRDEECHHE